MNILEETNQATQEIQIIRTNFINLMYRNLNTCKEYKQDIHFRFYETTEFIYCEIDNRTVNIFTTYKKALSNGIFIKATEDYHKKNTVEINDDCDFYDPFIKNTQIEYVEKFIANINDGYYHIVYGNEYISVHMILPLHQLEIIKRIYIN